MRRYRHPPAQQQRHAHFPEGEIGEADKGGAPDAQQLVEQPIGPLRGLQGLAEDGDIERAIGIIGQIAVGIALNHRKPARHRAFDFFGINLQPARIDLLFTGEHIHQLAIAAADIEHAHAMRHKAGDLGKIGAQAHPTNPFTTRSSAGTSSRKLSCPNGADSSTKLTGAATALSAWTMLRLSAVG